MNSRTSRPRSPISAMTFTSAPDVTGDHPEERALPDTGAGEDADALALAEREECVNAAIPVSSTRSIRGRRIGFLGRASSGRCTESCGGARSSRGRPTRRPRAPGARRPRRRSTGSEREDRAADGEPCALPYGTSVTWPGRMATISASTGVEPERPPSELPERSASATPSRSWPGRTIAHSSPTCPRGPTASTASPCGPRTTPSRRVSSTSRTGRGGWARRPSIRPPTPGVRSGCAAA